MRNYTPEQYKRVGSYLSEYISFENNFLSRIKLIRQATIVDLGSGYGRVIPLLASIGKKVIAVDVNTAMLKELVSISNSFGNVDVVETNFVNVHTFGISKDVPVVFVLLQNTLGTLECDELEFFNNLKSFAFSRDESTSIIISVFRQQALEIWGEKLYSYLVGMVGEIDRQASDIKNGLFVSCTGYTSQWRSDREIQNMKEYLGGTVVDEVYYDNYYILHINL